MENRREEAETKRNQSRETNGKRTGRGEGDGISDTLITDPAMQKKTTRPAIKHERFLYHHAATMHEYDNNAVRQKGGKELANLKDEVHQSIKP